jgi:hypothetical protein
MKTIRMIAVAAGVLLSALPLHAEETGTPVDPASIDAYARMEKAVNAKSIERVISGDKALLSPGDTLRLVFVAQQRALAENCDGYAVDEDRFNAVMTDILSGVQGPTEEGQTDLAVDIILGAYAMNLGGLTAMAAYDRDRFCARGAEIRAELAEDTEGKIAVLAPAE